MTKNKSELKEFNITSDSHLDNSEIYSQAYPNYDEYMYIPPPRDTGKWIEAVKNIYYNEKAGHDKNSAILATINKWDDIEKKDFFNWLKFYEEGAHLKYKYAQQMWYEGINPGYILPFKKDSPQADSNHAEDTLDEISTSEKKKIIEQQRKKIIGRLDSIEKLLRSDEGQMFANQEFETLLEIIYQLKKKIQLVNKKSSSTKLYDDMIIREANILNNKGFIKAASLLYKLADSIPTSTPPALPTNVSGSPTTIPGAEVGTAAPGNNPPSLLTPTKEQKEDKPSEGMEEFLEGLSGGNVTDDSDTNDLEVLDVDDDLIVEAQELPPPDPVKPIVAPVKPNIPEENLEVNEDVPAPSINDSNLEVEEPIGNDDSGTTSAFDGAIDNAFKNVKVDDIIQKLEDLAKIFKTREIPRQLAFVDMMLDTLGMSTFFPTLAEATNKSLESNQYVLTRVEDILSKLRGTMATNEIDLTAENPVAQSPEVQSLKGKLSEQDEKEKAKKKMRKELEDKKLQDANKEEPQIDIEEDLSQPTEVAPQAPPIAAPAPLPVK